MATVTKNETVVVKKITKRTVTLEMSWEEAIATKTVLGRVAGADKWANATAMVYCALDNALVPRLIEVDSVDQSGEVMSSAVKDDVVIFLKPAHQLSLFGGLKD